MGNFTPNLGPQQPLVGYDRGMPQIIEPMAARALPEHIDYLNLLWRRKWWIAAALFAGAILGTVSVIFQAPFYRAGTTIELLGVSESFMGMNQFDAQGGANATNVQTQIRILTSSALVSRVVERVNLELPPVSPPAPDLFGKIRNRLGLSLQEPVELTKEAVRIAASTLRARGVGASRLVEISCESISPEIASSFANAVATEYMSQFSQLRSTNNSRTTQWLEGQLEEAKSKVEQADKKLLAYARQSGLTSTSEQNPMAEARVQQLQSELSGVQSDRLAKQSKYEQLKSNPTDSVPWGEDPNIRILQEKLGELRREQAQLLLTLTPAHYRVQKVQMQITEFEQALQRAKDGYAKAYERRAQSEYEAALQREKFMTSAYSSQLGALFGQGDKGSQLSMLKRESEATRQIYNLLLQQLNQSAVVTAVPTNNVRVIDPAYPPGGAFKPQPTRDIVMGSIFGVSLLIGGIVLLENFRSRKLSRVFATPGHAGNLMEVPELGVIPSFDPMESGLWSGPAGKQLKRLQQRGFRRKPALPAAIVESSPNELIVWNQKPSFAAESFRFTLTSIFGSPNAPPKTLLILTSPGPGEGKTTVVSNLAVATVETGRTVLLIDADFRKPRVHTIFQVKQGPGFKDLIQSTEPVHEMDVASFVQTTSIEGLSVLTSGSGRTESAAPLLFSSRVPALLQKLRGMFDVVLIDTAPAMQFADARLLGRHSDGVILVVRSGVTYRENAIATRMRFKSDRIPILGSILNDWSVQDGAGDYYNAYAKYYYNDEKS